MTFVAGCPPGDRPEDRRLPERREAAEPDSDVEAWAPRRPRPFRRANSVSNDAIRAACCSTTCSRWPTRSMPCNKLTTSACTATGVLCQSLSEIGI